MWPVIHCLLNFRSYLGVTFFFCEGTKKKNFFFLCSFNMSIKWTTLMSVFLFFRRPEIISFFTFVTVAFISIKVLASIMICRSWVHNNSRCIVFCSFLLYWFSYIYFFWLLQFSPGKKWYLMKKKRGNERKGWLYSNFDG